MIHEVGAAIDNEPAPALQFAESEEVQNAPEEEEHVLVIDNLPWLVKTYFDFQDMVADVSSTEFWV